MKIKNLTQEQEKQLEVYKEKWLKIGLNTQRLNPDITKGIIDQYYTEILNKKIVPVVITKSPFEAWNLIKKETGIKDLNFIWPYMDGNFFASVLSFYDYFINCVGINIDKDLLRKFEIWKKMAYVSLVYSFDDICIVCEKPTEIHMLEGRLHKEDGPSVLYEDGFSVYSLNGIRVPKWVVETPANEISINKILKEKNVEIRRELVRKVGIERIYRKSKSKIIDKKELYELIEIDLGDNLQGRYLKMVNPSIDTIHLEGVPNECLTVDMALAWRNHQWEVGQPFNHFTSPDLLT